MAAIYWSIPLLVLGVSIAVVPVLYGTIKDREWEKVHGPRPAVVAVAETQVVDEHSAALHSFENIHEEVMSLVARLEQIRELALNERHEGRSELNPDSLTA